MCVCEREREKERKRQGQDDGGSLPKKKKERKKRKRDVNFLTIGAAAAVLSEFETFRFLSFMPMSLFDRTRREKKK